MEAYGIGSAGGARAAARESHVDVRLLDPVLPPEGKFLARWRLRLNVSPEEIQAVART